MGHIAGLVPFLCNEAQGMPASVAHAVFCGDIFFVFQSFRKGGHIQETADQVAVFGHHRGIAELIQLLRGTAVVSGQAVRLIIVGDFLKKVALQINKAKMQFFDGQIHYIRSTATHRKRQPVPYSSLKLHLANLCISLLREAFAPVISFSLPMIFISALHRQRNGKYGPCPFCRLILYCTAV